MSLIDTLLVKDLLPDAVLRFGIRRRLADTLREYRAPDEATRRAALLKHAASLRHAPLAVATDEANEQHYEVPTRFYQLVLGPHLKYSSGYWSEAETTMGEAEAAMLAMTCQRAEISDGMSILELGCGWGSLSLWMAEHYPQSRIVTVSNSRTQKEYIDQEAARRGLGNLTVRTANMVTYEGEGSAVFDRVVSVEMFEHMKNYAELHRRISQWLKPGGKLFVHIFTHRDCPYHFDVRSDDDWMAKYFFTGGQMPSHDLLPQYQDHLTLERDWIVNGIHYSRTSEMWLANMDMHREEIDEIFVKTYGANDAKKWRVWWRLFFMACAELWGYRQGMEWQVSHYRFIKPET